MFDRLTRRGCATLRILLMMVLALPAVSCGREPTPPITVPPVPPPPVPPPPVPPPPPPPAVVVNIAGNIGDCTSQDDDATSRVLDSLPGLVFAAGDNAFENGSAEEYANCFGGSWGRHRDRTWGVMGNHDYQLGNADAAFDWFGARAGNRGEGWYTIDLDSVNWRVIVLNDNAPYVAFDRNSPQMAWLRATLASNTRKCVLAIWHAPRFLSSNTAGFTGRGSHSDLWDALYQAGAELVVSAQQHHYERLLPMDPAGTADTARGIIQFNAGTGGGEGTSMPTVAIHPNSVVRSTAFGVLSLKLRDGTFEWTFRAVRGETFSDAGSGTCH